MGRWEGASLVPVPVHRPVSWALPLRALYARRKLLRFCLYSEYNTRPQGQLVVAPSAITVAASTVPGAGLGLFAAEALARGQPLGYYPGRVFASARDFMVCSRLQ